MGLEILLSSLTLFPLEQYEDLTMRQKLKLCKQTKFIISKTIKTLKFFFHSLSDKIHLDATGLTF